MASVLDVASYILHKQGQMTSMKLQKLVYYSQGWSLAWDDVPLFDEDFEAWANGPVCPRLFGFHRGLFVLEPDHFDQFGIKYDAELDENQRETIDIVLEYYGEKEPYWLSTLSHTETPWKDARKGFAPGTPSSEVITKESMQLYYGGLE
ncbi:DUF4065 domain-containing protein [Eubacteriales bacterium OttesenSCG-928-M02]|nr:DUF4065 domain-containing protein [Eubacteriales bacterium OttesenSCG-928-M02]